MLYFNKITNFFKIIKKSIYSNSIIIVINKHNHNFDYNIIDNFVYEYYYEYVSQCNNYKIIIDSTKIFHQGITTTTNYISVIDNNNFSNSILGHHQRQNGFEAYNSHIEILNYKYIKYSSRGIFENAKEIEYINSEKIIKLIIK